MITITERKLQTYLYSLIIITPKTKCDCGFRHIFCPKLVRRLFGLIDRLPIIRPRFSRAHFFWNPFVRCIFVPFVLVPICPGAHLSGAHLSGAHLSETLFRDFLTPGNILYNEFRVLKLEDMIDVGFARLIFKFSNKCCQDILTINLEF